MSEAYPRDFVGYGGNPPDPRWPGGARLAVQFVLNYEEGGENTVLNGDAGSETYLNETPGGVPVLGQRDINMETQYEYGARAGFWRILRLFGERGLPFTCYAVGLALERNPLAARAMVEAGHEIASHGYRWISYQNVPEEVERAHIRQAIAAIERCCGARPLGWYTGRVSPRTRRLVIEEGGFLYDSDAYNDDLPYWVEYRGESHLVIPYTLDNNDMKFSVPPGFSGGDDFFLYLRDAFDCLYREGASQPKMMSVGLHCRLVGRPGRAEALRRFLDYVQSHPDVWICRRVDIARHWHEHHRPAR
ncbi:MAG: allantoinase PuuE [Alphaproteobacteria bacterium]|nr:allantoinase PuuE [Alphaproteobacteria bacterium]